MHIRKEIIDCNCKIQKNLSSNSPTFGYVILLTIDHKIHNTKYHRFQPCLPLLRVYLQYHGLLRPTSKQSQNQLKYGNQNTNKCLSDIFTMITKTNRGKNAKMRMVDEFGKINHRNSGYLADINNQNLSSCSAIVLFIFASSHIKISYNR